MLLKLGLVLAATLNTLLGLFVLLRSRKKKVNIAYAIFAIITALWVFSNFLVSYSINLTLVRFSYAIGILVPLSSIHWINLLSNPVLQKKRRIILPFFYCWSIVIVLLTVLSNKVILGFEKNVINGQLFPLYVASSLVYISYAIYQVIHVQRNSVGIRKIQLRVILIGLMGFSFITAFVSLILPIFGYERLAKFDSTSSLLFVALSAYAIVKHRFLDIRVVITRSLIYGILVTAVALSLISVLFLSAQFFGDTPSSRYTISFFVATLIVFGLDPFKRVLSRATDKIFFKAKIDYQAVLQNLTEILSVELDLGRLTSKLDRALAEGLKLKHALVLPRVDKKNGPDVFEVASAPDQRADPSSPVPSLTADSPLATFVREHKHPSLVDSLERKIDDASDDKKPSLEASQRDFEQLQAALLAPVFVKDQMNAVLALGPKLSGETFSNEDLQLVAVLGPQIGSAIEKAKLYDEVKSFSERMKVRVEEATRELKERNVSLLTLQHITKDITRSLDFNKIVQNIADSIASELGYLGAILVFLDDDGYTARARAITQTPITKRAAKLLPKSFDQWPSDLRDPKYTNMEAQVLRTGEIKMTEKIHDVVCPPLPKILADAMQRVLAVKGIIIIPIHSEDKIIGVIEVGTKRPPSEFSKREVDTLQSIADQLGIIYRNIKLFDAVNKANTGLAEANAHLKELDQAKSEFVSIASHQLRTPMTGIMGYLSMLTAGDFGKVVPKHNKILVDLLAESQRMIRLINQFLNVSKIEAGKLTYTKAPIQVESLIEREIREVSKMAADKGLKIIAHPPAKPLPLTMADGDKIQDVILNLMDNAIKYTTSGSVTISAEQQEQNIHVMIQDTGIGIKQGDALNLFNKFVRGSGIAQLHPDGSGLGLFYAKSIIDAHGGRIWVESAGEGKGSIFQFTIPIVSEPTQTVKKV